MLDAAGQGSQTAATGSLQTNPSRKRSREFFDTLAQLITKNVNKKPVLLPKRQPSESELLAQYHASRLSQQQPSQRTSAAFHYSPARKPAPPASIFSPATSKLYSSPTSGSAGPGASPSIPLAPLPTQQQGLFGRGLAQSSATTPVHNRVNPPLSRLGPSRLMAQPTTPLRPMQYLNSAPAVGPSPVASSHPAASSSFTPPSNPLQTGPLYGYHGGPLTSNTSPHDAQHDFGFGTDAISTEDQDLPRSPEFDRMHGQRGFNGRQPEGFQNAVAEQAPSSQQPASKAPANPRAPVGSQPENVRSAKQEAVKQLIAKNKAALSRFASPAPSTRSPFQAAGLQHKAYFENFLKRKASQALAEETWPKASRQRMETALTGISKAEEAVKQESAAATTPSRPRPPTAVLGFAPPSPFSPATKPATGKYSWPANFFDNSKNKKICQAADSEQESAPAGGLPDESVDTGAVSSHMGNGDSMAGRGQEKDFGAAWRDAAQSPQPAQSPASAPHNEDTPQVTSPPFAVAPPQQQQQPQPMVSRGLPDPASPNRTRSATPPLAAPTAFARMFGMSQHTPAAPPLASMFAYAASPATVPVKSRHKGSSGEDLRQVTGDPMPAMFSAAISTAAVAAADSNNAASDCAPLSAGTDAAAASKRGVGLLPDNQAAMATTADSAAAENLTEGAAASKPAEDVKGKEDPSKPVANGWGAALLASNQAAAAKATEAIAEAAETQEKSSKPVANGWGASLLASNQAAAAKATEAVAKAQETSSKSVANGWDVALLASNQVAAVKATEAVAEAAKGSETPSKSVANGWGAALLASNQAAAAKATEAVAAAAKAQETPSMPVANGWGAALLASNQAAAAKATEAVAEAAKARETSSMPVANGWGAALLTSNQAAAAKATDAVAEAAKAWESQAGAFTSQATAAAANTAAAAAPAPMQFQFGVALSAEAGWGSTTGTGPSMPAVPVMSGPFHFGVTPAGTTTQTASPPMAVPAAQVTATTPHGENSLGRDGSWMSISPKSCDFQQPTPARPLVPPPQQGNHVFGPAPTTNGQPPFGSQPAVGLFMGLAGQSQVGPAQLSAFPGPSSNFTLGAAGNDSRPTPVRHKKIVSRGVRRKGR